MSSDVTGVSIWNQSVFSASFLAAWMVHILNRQHDAELVLRLLKIKKYFKESHIYAQFKCFRLLYFLLP